MYMTKQWNASNLMKRAADTDAPVPACDLKRVRRNKSTKISPTEPVRPNLDVEELVAARKTEILALHRAMAQARASTNARAWQLLPRHLRRRAASHNLLRLPRRLRGKARAELRASNTAAKTRSQMRRRMPERTLKAYVRRRTALKARAGRKDRRWLETHMWHAKRFRMSGEKAAPDGGAGRWGFSLAETPHHKSFRMTWRKTSHAVMHDASYTSAFYVTARAKRLVDATTRLQLFLMLLGAAHGWEDSWTSGSRLCRTALLDRPYGAQKRTKARAAFLRVISPLQVLWVPRVVGHAKRACVLLIHPAAVGDLQCALEHALDTLRAEQKRPRHICAVPQRWTKHVDIQARQVDMAPSPAVAAGVWHEDATKRPPKDIAVSRPAGASAFEEGWNVFEVLGDHAAHALGRVLHLRANATEPESTVLHQIVHRDPEPTAWLPSDMVLTFDVIDPRLSSKVMRQTSGCDRHLALTDASLQDEDLPRYTSARFFQKRHTLPSPTALIDRRRARGDVHPRVDDTLTIMMIQRHIETSPGTRPMYGFVLFIPRGWGAVFWNALARTGVQVLGQAQQREIYLNMGLPLFPYDWVGHAAHVSATDQDEKERKAHWLARPPAKRVQLDPTMFPYPFGGIDLWAKQGEAVAKRPVIVPTLSTEAAEQLDKALCRIESSSPVPRRQVPTRAWTRRQYVDGILQGSRPMPLPPDQRPFVLVLIVACRRGAFDENATLHMPAMDALPAWHRALDPPTSLKAAAREQLHQLEAQPVSVASMAGAVSTGHYALATGHGRAIAALQLDAWLELERRQRILDEQESQRPRWGQWKRNRVPLKRLVLVRPAMTGPVRAASVHRVLTLT